MEGTTESSHDFVLCPSIKHQRRRIRPLEGEDLDIWVSLMKAGGARCGALPAARVLMGDEGPSLTTAVREQKAR